MTTETDLVALWRTLFAEPTEGWDFSSFGDRIAADAWPWDYNELAQRVLADSSSALDMGTGGGEVLIGLADALPDDTVATEGWATNVPVARAALASYGIDVVPYDAERDDSMPFPDGRFDVVLNRHEAMELAEVTRVLRPGGRLVTQQVDGRNFAESHAMFGNSDSPYAQITLAHLTGEAEAAGLMIEDAREWQGSIRFADVATLVSYLRMVPWEVPEDFTVDRYASQLLALHQAAQDDPDRLSFGFGGFYFQARRPD